MMDNQSETGDLNRSTFEACLLPEHNTKLNTPEFIIPICVLIIFNFVVILGNCLVITAVFTLKKLRTSTNTFIVSLAVSDLALGAMVLPFSSANEVLWYWPFGSIWCSVWLAVDVWLSTASILNLCAISFDRYLAITRPFKYPRLMSSIRSKMLVFAVWLVSFMICFPPLIGWNERGKNISDGFIRDSGETISQTLNTSGIIANEIPHSNVNYSYVDTRYNGSVRRDDDHCIESISVCELTAESGYVIYSALGSFWIPVWVMVFFYWRIYKTAAHTTSAIKHGVLRTKSRQFRSSTSDKSVTLRVHRGGGGARSPSLDDGPSLSLLSERQSSISRLSGISPRGSIDKDAITEYKDYKEIGEENQNVIASNYKYPKLPKIKVTFNRTPSYSTSLYHESEGSEQSIQMTTTAAISANGTKYKQQQETYLTKDEEDNTSENPSKGILTRMGKIQWKQHLKRINREKKAAKTVGIIVGCFIICWAPFFSVYLLGAFCEDCTPRLVFSIFFWLGYCNSAINPFVYALFSPDFRYAFKKLLSCNCELNKRRKRSRNLFSSFLNSIRIRVSSKDSDSLSE